MSEPQVPNDPQPHKSPAAIEQNVMGAQRQIDTALERVGKTRRLRGDDTELILDPEYESARQELLRLLYDLPDSVRCLSVDIAIPPCPQNPTTEIHYLNKNLRNLIAPMVNQASDFDRSVDATVTIRPPQMPEELKAISFGSQARALSEQVVETVVLGEKGSISLLEINPLGEPKTSAARNFNALRFLVPLRYVRSITVETEDKPLTPYLERNPDGSLVTHQVTTPEATS